MGVKVGMKVVEVALMARLLIRGERESDCGNRERLGRGEGRELGWGVGCGVKEEKQCVKHVEREG